MAASQSDRVTGTLGSARVANVTLSPAHLVGGDSTAITVNLSQPAPGGGIDVQLQSSDPSVVTPPASVRITSGQTSATVEASTSPVAAATIVAISALLRGYGQRFVARCRYRCGGEGSLYGGGKARQRHNNLRPLRIHQSDHHGRERIRSGTAANPVGCSCRRRGDP